MNSVHSVFSTLDSRGESVDGAEEVIRQFALEAGFDESDQYFIGLAAREIIINAMKHGNHFDRDKRVGMRLSKDEQRLTIEVFDEGAGFQLESVPDPRLPENRERRTGRGLTIALAIMDEFAVEKNAPSGTLVRLVKRLPPR